jgi:hypothetical protein
MLPSLRKPPDKSMNVFLVMDALFEELNIESAKHEPR